MRKGEGVEGKEGWRNDEGRGDVKRDRIKEVQYVKGQRWND